MTRLKKLATIFALALALGMPLFAHACPACREAVAAGSSGDEEDYANAPAAYNQSIYLMVGAPYLSLGVFSWFVYRGCKKNAAYLTSLGEGPDSGNN